MSHSMVCVEKPFAASATLPFALITYNPFRPHVGREVVNLKAHFSIHEIVHQLGIDTTRAFVVCHEGRPILRAYWDKVRIKHGCVSISYLPLGGGGGGSNPLTAVLTIALMVVAPYAAGLLGGMLGVTSAAGIGMLQAGVMMLGGAIIQSVGPKPDPLSGQNNLRSASPTYSLGASGNTVRLGQALPVVYGVMRVYPDLAAIPYAYYDNNSDQWLCQVMIVSYGKRLVSKLLLEDSKIESFEGVAWRAAYFNRSGARTWLDNGTTPTFPEKMVKMVTTGVVSGQELTATWLGAYVINPPLTQINLIEYDVVCPNGLYYGADDGTFTTVSCQFTVEYRLIDDQGTALSGWTVTMNHKVSAATNNALRMTYSFDVPNGRYEVRAKRMDKKETGARYGHTVVWAALKGQLVANPQWIDMTVIYVKMKATKGLSGSTTRKLNCLATAQIAVPWRANSIDVYYTPAIAIYDALTSWYGGELTANDIDLDSLKTLDNFCIGKRWRFDAVIDNQQPLWDVVGKMAAAALSVMVQQGNQLRVILDQPRTIPCMGFRPDNIVRDSLSVEYIQAKGDTISEVVAFYRSRLSWRDVTYPDYNPNRQTATIETFGVTTEPQVAALVTYHKNKNLYRRKRITFNTELEGMIPTIGDLISITHDLIGRGSVYTIEKVLTPTQCGYPTQSGWVAITLVEGYPDDFEGKAYYWSIRTQSGAMSEQVQGVKIRVAGTWLLKISNPNSQWRLYPQEPILLGEFQRLTQLALVQSTRPASNGQVAITAWGYDERVYLGYTAPTEWLGAITYQYNSTTGALAVQWPALAYASQYQVTIRWYYQYFEATEDGLFIVSYSTVVGTGISGLSVKRSGFLSVSVVAQNPSIWSPRSELTKTLDTSLLSYTPPSNSTDLIWYPVVTSPLKYVALDSVGKTLFWLKVDNAVRYQYSISGQGTISDPAIDGGYPFESSEIIVVKTGTVAQGSQTSFSISWSGLSGMMPDGIRSYELYPNYLSATVVAYRADGVSSGKSG